MTTTNNAPISFRLTDDELELLRQHQEDGEKSLNLTAKRLLLSALGVEVKKPSIQVVNSVDMIQVQELIETAVQEKLEKLTIVDNVDTIKNLIAESLADGEIKEAIASAYTAAMGQFNGLLEELQELKKQFEEFKSSSATVPSPQLPMTNDQLPPGEGSDRTPNTLTQSPITNDQLPPGDDLTEMKSEKSPSHQSPVTNDQSLMTNDQIVEALGIHEILLNKGNKNFRVYAEWLREQGINEKIRIHQQAIEELIGIKLSLEDNTADIKAILKAMGHNIKTSTTMIKSPINQVDCIVESSSNFYLVE
ncbi:hypothetical protein [Trichormus sp. NMC-1]|uniref:hypothetical protein n=1 Tax=Trichormus sp. NMC-1 TaxID=1853259 RepID=UPI0008DBEEBF|nr:hypothetical protein [Trichormus sp. NMC-1]